MLYESLLEITLVILFGHCQKVENVWVLERLSCQVGLGFRECYSEIVDRSSLALIGATFYLMHEYASAPVMGHCALNIENGLFDTPAFRNDGDIVSPRDRGDLGNESSPRGVPR
jgi:hypothetical protein